MMKLKITTVGDHMVGKTCLLMTYTQKEFPDKNVPAVFDNHVFNIIVDNKDCSLNLWDTNGQDDFERIRPFDYINTDCFLLCYSISSKSSFENVLSTWYPEIRHFSLSVKIILVGTKSDLRIQNSKKFVTKIQGEKLKKEIGAKAFVECSAKNNEQLTEVFEEAVKSVYTFQKEGKYRTCKLQ